MRETFEFIDSATRDQPELRQALYYITAQQLAGQALSLAFATRSKIDAAEARSLIERVAGYPGVTARWMTESKKLMVGDYATEVLIRLAKERQSYFNERPSSF